MPARLAPPRSALLAALALALPIAATAVPLDPLAYSALGSLNLGAGTYTLVTDGAAPTLRDGLNAVLYTGVLVSQSSSFNPSVAVFDFSSINIAAGAVITASGNKPVALLSQSGLSFGGLLNANGADGGPQGAGTGGVGGPGAGAGGNGGGNPAQSGGGPGGGGGGYAGLGNGSWGEGGAFGGLGSNWNPALTPAPTYGDLTQNLEAGSGGGGGGANLFGSGPGGGGGGGGVEFGAVTFITMAGNSQLLAQGGQGGGGLAVNAGGGSGGGLLLHAPSIAVLSDIRVALIDAGGFSGGRIAFLTSDGTVAGNLAGTSVGADANGHPGVITFGTLAPVPEPASLLLMLGGLAALGWRRLRPGGLPA